MSLTFLGGVFSPWNGRFSYGISPGSLEITSELGLGLSLPWGAGEKVTVITTHLNPPIK